MEHVQPYSYRLPRWPLHVRRGHFQVLSAVEKLVQRWCESPNVAHKHERL